MLYFAADGAGKTIWTVFFGTIFLGVLFLRSARQLSKQNTSRSKMQQRIGIGLIFLIPFLAALLALVVGFMLVLNPQPH
jgi:hypothetical protein